MVERSAGWLPYSGLLPGFTGDGVLLVGNAAGQVRNMLGGGVETTIAGADMAARTIVGSLEAGDHSADFLGRYEREYRESEYGASIERTAEMLSHLIAFSGHADLFYYLEELVGLDDEEAMTSISSGKIPYRSVMRFMTRRPDYVLRALREYFTWFLLHRKRDLRALRERGPDWTLAD